MEEYPDFSLVTNISRIKSQGQAPKNRVAINMPAARSANNPKPIVYLAFLIPITP